LDKTEKKAAKVVEKNLLLHFAHANGFPAGSYNKLFENLTPNISLIALDKFAHTPQFPPNNNWENQADELIHYVESKRNEHNLHFPIVLAGHSFGALISFLACCKRPELFSGLIMLDPPLMTGLVAWVFRFAKKNRLIDKITPAGKSKIRNTKWHHKTDLVKYFKARALFKNMDDDCISDYVNAVTKRSKDERILDFSVQVETDIFRTIPDNLHKYYGKLTTPSYLLTGKNTEVCLPILRRRFLEGNPAIVHQELNFGGHMFPLEKPLEVAKKINDTIQKLVGRVLI
jgi:pimeloyl-ACP methyl ester carboxylesterase